MFRNIAVILSANSSSFVTSMRTAGGALDDFGDKGDRTAVRSEAAAGRMSKAWMGVGVVVAGGLIAAGVAAAGFEQRMRNVNSISGLSEEAFRKQGQAVLDLSKTLPQSANNLAEGLYDIASSGFQGAEGLQVLEASAKAASAGLATTAEAGKAITAVLNAYGLESTEARRVSDVLFQTVNLGVVSFSELTGVIGDVVGTAAAAGVSIEQVGAAVATMTLSGVTAAEAGTSLNRVLQSFIKPSDEMRAALAGLGYESGVTALKQEGLRGIMEKLRVSTKGNIEVTAQLFDEQRALRGALALMSDEGRNHEKVLAGMATATEGVGATQRAFSEQMKSVSAQIKIAKNEIVALAIQGATPLLGFLNQGITGGRELAKTLGEGVTDAVARLRPFFVGLASAGGDVVRMLGSIADGAGPVVTALAALSGGAVIGTLNALATALAGITEFAADHSGVIAALAIIYGTNLALGVAGATAQFLVWRTSAIASAVASSTLTMAIQQQAHYFGLLGLAIRALPYVVLIGGITATVTGIANAKRQADELAGSLDAGLNLTTQSGLDEYLSRINSQRDALRETTNEGNRFTRFLKAVYEFGTDAKNTLADATEGINRLTKEQVAASRESISFRENINTVRHATGLSAEAVELLAVKLGVDLKQGFGKSGDARAAIIRDFNGIKTGARDAGVAIGNIADLSKEGLEELAARIESNKKAIDDTVKATTGAFEKSFNLVSNYAQAAKDQEKATDGVTKAQERLTDAQKSLAKLRERQAADDKLTIADSQALEAAQEKVAEAQRDVAKSQQEVADTSLSGFFARQVADAQKFATDIRAAAAAGLDPEIIKRLLMAGPEQAAPFLKGMLEGNIATNVAMANEAQRSLDVVNAQMVESARVTQRAINATNTEMAADYEKAMSILAAKAALGGKATAEALAENLGMKVEEVRRIAQEYVIVLAASLNPLLRGLGATEIGPEQITPTGERYVQGQGGRNLADGGVLDFYARGGVREDHVAQIAPAGAWRVWAEDETGGEAYIPLAESKRDRSTSILRKVAERFGMALVSYAEGGIASLPKPPDLSGYGNMVGYTADESNRYVYEKVRAYIEEREREAAAKKAAASSGTVGDGKIGEGWRAITDYLDSVGQAYTITSTLRPGAITSSGNLSNHALGKAVDMVGDMPAIFRTLLNIAGSLSELFYDPAGRSVKNGQLVDWTVGGHDDHVHAATFDQGGSLYPGWNRLYNGTGKMETLAPVYPSHSASSLVSPVSGKVEGPDLRALVGEIVSAVQGMGHDITIELDGDVIARVASKGMDRMARSHR